MARARARTRAMAWARTKAMARVRPKQGIAVLILDWFTT